MNSMMKRIWRIRTCLSNWINENPVPGRENNGRRELPFSHILLYELSYPVGGILLAVLRSRL